MEKLFIYMGICVVASFCPLLALGLLFLVEKHR